MAKRYKPRPDGRFATSIYVGEGDNRKLKIVYGKTQKELKAKVDLIKEKNEASDSTFLDYAQSWKAEKEIFVGVNTFKTYVQCLGKLEPIFGTKFSEIKISDVQNIINGLFIKEFSRSIIKRTKQVFFMVVDYANKQGEKTVFNRNLIEIPKNAKVKERTSILDEEIEIIKNSVNLDFGLFPFLLLFTGIRRGEAAALQWKDINLENKTISINKSVEYLNNDPNIKKPKTKSGIRIVPITNNLLPYLEKQPSDKELYIFGGQKLLTLQKLNWDLRKYFKQTGLSITLHQLRHTYATILYKAEIDPKTAQGLLGHSDFATTMNIYTHIGEEISKQTFDKINNFIEA